MANWDGKSKGSLLGYKIFIFLIKTFGVQSAYFLLYFVAFYFLIFSRKGTQASYYFFHNRLGYSKLKSYYKVYKNNYVFGQTIIDRFAIHFGLRDQYTYTFDGVENLHKLVEENKGGILISAHVGNFEIAEYFFNEVDVFSKVNLVTTDNEHREIKEQFDKVSSESTINFILVKDDMSHIFKINEAFNKNELVCFTGDRFFDDSKVLSEELLGKKARFPAGPFLLASRLKVPVAFVYVMKETATHYHLYTRLADFKNRDAQGLLKNYTESIATVIEEYPYQWFNYYDFWEDYQ